MKYGQPDFVCPFYCKGKPMVADDCLSIFFIFFELKQRKKDKTKHKYETKPL